MNRISYSQYSMWSQCPFRWKLRYVDKIKELYNSIKEISEPYVIRVLINSVAEN